jgi:hypothetical protein
VWRIRGCGSSPRDEIPQLSGVSIEENPPSCGVLVVTCVHTLCQHKYTAYTRKARGVFLDGYLPWTASLRGVTVEENPPPCGVITQ